MGHGQSPLVIGQVFAHRRPEASFSQGARWKRLISKYITVMPSIGRMRESEVQSVMGDVSFAAIHAMSANVGEAARASQPVAPRVCQVLELSLFAAETVVILPLPIDYHGSRMRQDLDEIYAEAVAR
jgi:hypothetical protein